VALRKIRVSEQCTQFTRSGERCSLTVIEGEHVCALHANMIAIGRVDERAPLTTSSSQRDVSRRVLGSITKTWPSVVFELKKGWAATGNEVLVLCWTNGPTETQVQKSLSGLFSSVALGWGMPAGAPGVECSRSYSPEVLVAALIEQSMLSEPELPGKKVTHAWVRKLLVPSIGFLQRVENPDEALDRSLVEAAERIIERCPPEDNLMDRVWLAQVTVFAVSASITLKNK
jgi:hypothetical protein